MSDKRAHRLFSMRVVAICLALLIAGCQKTEQASDAQTTKPGNNIVASDTASDTADPQDARITEHDVSHIVTESTLTPAAASQWPAARYATAGRIKSELQRSGDATKGRQALLDEAYVSCGLPERVFRDLLGDAPVLEAPDRSPDAAGLPFSNTVSTNEAGQRIVSNNCLTCHGTSLFGELVIGLGNEFLDFSNDASAFVERAGALVQGSLETSSWELYANRIAAIAPYTRMHTVGVNPANNLTFALIAHRRAEDNAWSDEPLLALPPIEPPPVSVPPWWRMKKKPAMFNLGEGRGDHARIMMAASMLCTDTPEALAAIDAYAPDIRAFIDSVQAPVWPFERDDTLAASGKVLFEANCSQCHGTYGEDGEYPARLVPIDVINTDSTLVDFAHDEAAPYIDWFNRSYYGKISTAAPGPGYVAPPLDGIWATAPYLHNGSVPSIRSVLDSSTRPAIWQHLATSANDKAAYDQQNLGWNFQALGDEPVASPKPVNVYDTSRPGYANSGHTFGDHLSDEQRSAVLEYLKSL